jgi:hypothetical protein
MLPAQYYGYNSRYNTLSCHDGRKEFQGLFGSFVQSARSASTIGYSLEADEKSFLFCLAYGWERVELDRCIRKAIRHGSAIRAGWRPETPNVMNFKLDVLTLWPAKALVFRCRVQAAEQARFWVEVTDLWPRE